MRKTDIPVYELILAPLEDGGKEATGFDKIAYVSDPAIDEVGIYLSAEQLIVQQRNFKLSNAEKQQVVAPLLIPNKLIDRNDKGYYQIKFSAEVIQQLKDKADAEGKLSSLNIMKDTHKGAIAPSYILEDWIIESEDDKAYTEYGFDINRVPVGTWMVITQVIDKDYWENEIKKNKKFAYSIEAFLNMRLTNLKLNKTIIEKENNNNVATENGVGTELNKNKTEMENEDKVTFVLDGKTYELIDGKPVLVDEIEEQVEVDVNAVEDKEVEAQEDEKKDEEVVAEEDKKEEEVKAEEDKDEEKVAVEVEAQEDEEAAPEANAEEAEATEEAPENGDEDKFEAIYEEIAKLREMISKITEDKPEEAKIEMSEQLSQSSSIVALRKAIKSNR